MGNYPKELMDLLQQYLTDGVITEKERVVLLRKAETLNVDKDEFDLYIDAEVQKIDEKITAVKNKEKGKECPYCHKTMPMLSDMCPHCNRHVTPQKIKEFEDILNNLDESLGKLKFLGEEVKEASNPMSFTYLTSMFDSPKKKYAQEKVKVEGLLRKAKMYYGSDPKVQFLVEEINREIEKTESAIKRARIKLFVIIAVIIVIYIALMGFLLNFLNKN